MKEKIHLPDERPTIGIFVFSFLSGASYIMMRAVAVSLFLSRAGPDRLPMAFAASAAGVILVAMASRMLMRFIDSRRGVTLTWGLLAAASVAVEVGCATFADSLLVVTLLYVLADVRGSLGTIYLVTMSSEQLDPQSKRRFTIVASGAPLAGIIVGLLLGVEAAVVGVLPVLIVVAAVDLANTAWAWFFLARAKPAKKVVKESQEPVETNESRDRLRLGISAIFALKVIVLTLITFQWEVTVSSFFGDDETGMVAYFAYFFGVSDLLIVGFQWFAAGALLDRFGVRFALVGFPLMIGLVGAAAFAMDSAAAMIVVYTIAKGMNVFRRSLHDPALTVVYSVMAPESRDNAIVLNKGIIKPLAEAMAIGLLLLLGLMLEDVNVTGIWLVMVIPWLCMGLASSAWYRQTRLAMATS